MTKLKRLLASCLLLFACTQGFSQSTIRIEDASSFTSGFCGFNGSRQSSYAGASNGFYINIQNSSAKGIDWKVNAPAAGSYSLTWRYANAGSGSATSGRVLVNGSTALASVSFPKTATWSTWTITSAAVSLPAGVSTIRLETIVSSEFANIDWIEVTGNNPAAASCSGTPPPPTNYTLTVSNSPTAGGTVSTSPSGSSFAAGTVVTLTATPASGYVFSGWSGSLTGTANPATVTMDANKSVTANYTQSGGGGGGGTPDVSMIGYATLNGGTTGGQGGSSVTISTLAELQAWAASRENNTMPQIAYINGRIAASSTTLISVKHGANVSILGIGSTAELQNIGLKIWDYNNVIVRNLKIHEVFYPDDALTLDDVVNGWIDHCEFYSKIGAGIGVDTYDGLLDIKNGSRFITVSWNYLHHHMKNMLYGHTDGSSQGAIDGQMRITLHHNFIESTDGRNPSLRYGAVHMFNNYFKNITDYGIAARQGAHALIQNNVYENVALPITTNKFTGEGYACESGNIFTGCGPNSITQTGCDFWTSAVLPYSYTLDAASNVTSIVPPNVGVGKITITPPSGTRTDLVEVVELNNNPGNKLVVYQNYPNPARGATAFRIYTPAPVKVQISLYDVSGKKLGLIADKTLNEGYNLINYSTTLSPGLYIYEVKTGKDAIRKTMVIQ
jgi:uncharacterized repeat protein (TIGR02543 family)